MKKSNILSVMCGLVIITTMIIMIFRLGLVASENCIHSTDWSLGVRSAVQITTSIYGIIIIIFTIILVLINIFKKKKNVRKLQDIVKNEKMYCVGNLLSKNLRICDTILLEVI